MSLENLPKFLLNFSENEMKSDLRHSYRFKAFRLEVEERRLLHHDQPVPLTPKAFDVLVALVERSGHLVEKDELMQLVWMDSFVEEANLARLVHTLRKALGDDGNRYIATVAKKGYRFVAEVDEVCDFAGSDKPNGNGHSSEIAKNLSALDSAETAPAENTGRIPRSLFFIAGFVSAVAILFFSLIEIEVRPVNSFPKDKSKTIAVLPFKPVSTTKRDRFFEIGAADSLIRRLSVVKDFVIRPLNATRKYSEIEADAAAVGKEQQVDYVLASNYELIDEKIRVTAQLVNAANGQVEETYKIEKTLGDVFAVQDAIAMELGDDLMKRFAVELFDIRATEPEQ